MTGSVFWMSRSGLQRTHYDETLKSYVTEALQTPFTKKQLTAHVLPRVSGDLKKVVQRYIDIK